MMNKNQIIKLLEKRFVENHNMMDKENELRNYERASHYAGISCEIADILAEINGTSIDGELERLYKKFNLYKGE